MKARRGAGLALLLSLGACASGAGSPPPADRHDDLQARAGAGFVARACAGCHAVGLQGVSRDPAAPPFRILAARASDETLSAALARVAQHGHVQMPPIYMTDDEQAAVAAYLKRLRRGALPRA